MNDAKMIAIRLLDTFDQILRLSRNWGAGLDTTRQTDQILIVTVEGVNVQVRVSVAATDRTRSSD
jgi:hypothetical protein